MSRRFVPAGACLLLATTFFSSTPALATDDGSCEGRLKLEADIVSYHFNEQSVRADGDVKLKRDGYLLSTSVLTYRRDTGRIEIRKPFTVKTPDESLLRGDEANFDEQLANATITGILARIANTSGTLRAAEAVWDGRDKLHLRQAAYSACPISSSNALPAWGFIADEITHDRPSRDLIFRNTFLRVLGFPVLWLPWLRIPDPTVERRTGWLLPTLHSKSAYGLAIRTPYHFAFAADRQATLTPFITARDGLILEADYEQLYTAGHLKASASVTHNRLPNSPASNGQGHVFFDVRVPRGSAGTYGAEVRLAASKGYLRRYDYSEEDRLLNRLYFERYDSSRIFEAEMLAFQSQRESEDNKTLPRLLPEIRARRLFDNLDIIGGSLTINSSGRLLQRQTGRNVSSLEAGSEWNRTLTLPKGLRLALHGDVRASRYWINDNTKTSNPKSTVSRAFAEAGFRLSWPLLRTDSLSSKWLEPFVQVIRAASPKQQNIPDEDSVAMEFTELSLSSWNRFPGRDRIEPGVRATVGLHYQHKMSTGTKLRFSGGQVFRKLPTDLFPDRSGIGGLASDLVGGWRLTRQGTHAYDFGQRFRVDSRLRMQSNEFSLQANWGQLRLNSTYVYFRDDPQNNAVASAIRSEWQTTIGFPVDRHWDTTLHYRQRLGREQSITVGGSFVYSHPCFNLRFDIERDFNESINAPSGTEISVYLNLLTLGEPSSEE